MHNKRSQKKKKKKPRTMLFLNELKNKSLTVAFEKCFILAMSCVSFVTCTHTLVANENLSYDQEVKH